MGRAIMRVSDRYMADLLSLPRSCAIVPRWVEFEVDDPDIPDDAISVNPSFEKREPVVFVAWNPTLGEK